MIIIIINVAPISGSDATPTAYPSTDPAAAIVLNSTFFWPKKVLG